MKVGYYAVLLRKLVKGAHIFSKAFDDCLVIDDNAILFSMWYLLVAWLRNDENVYTYVVMQSEIDGLKSESIWSWINDHIGLFRDQVSVVT